MIAAPSSLLALVAVHENAQGADLVDKGLDGGVAADAEADGGEVDDDESVEDQDRGPPASPTAHARTLSTACPLQEALHVDVKRFSALVYHRTALYH